MGNNLALFSYNPGNFVFEIDEKSQNCLITVESPSFQTEEFF